MTFRSKWEIYEWLEAKSKQLGILKLTCTDTVFSVLFGRLYLKPIPQSDDWGIYNSEDMLLLCA